MYQSKYIALLSTTALCSLSVCSRQVVFLNADQCNSAGVAVIKEYQIKSWRIIHSGVGISTGGSVELTDRSTDRRTLQVCNYYYNHPSSCWCVNCEGRHMNKTAKQCGLAELETEVFCELQVAHQLPELTTREHFGYFFEPARHHCQPISVIIIYSAAVTVLSQ